MIRISRKEFILKKFILVVGVLGAIFYPIVIYPYFNAENYRDVQRSTRRGINRQDIQPGNMNIWKNPFAPSPKKEEQNQ